MMKYCNEIEKYYAERMNELEDRIVEMGRKLEENEESLRSLLVEKPKEV